MKEVSRMSETVKLIIEIPRNEYEYTCERTLSDRTFWDNAIRKGIPLDNVKAEITKKAFTEEMHNENHKGHWEEDGHGHIICSACKEANVSTWKSRFCPMCGADMREPKGEKGKT